MPINRVKLYEDIGNSDLERVLFSDPLSDTARKTRRNLIISSVACILIAVFSLKVTGFLGLKTDSGAIENEIVKGLGAVICLYYLVVFLIYSVIDIFAWNFRSEKSLVKPFQELVENIENEFHVLNEQVKGYSYKLSQLSTDSDMQTQVHNQEQIKILMDYSKGHSDGIEHIHSEIEPFLRKWKEHSEKLAIANSRFRLRLMGLVGIDLIVPIVLATVALYKTIESIPAAWLAVFYS